MFAASAGRNPAPRVCIAEISVPFRLLHRTICHHQAAGAIAQWFLSSKWLRRSRGTDREDLRGMTVHQLHDPRTYRIIGAAMEVHRILHRGLLEQIYCEALAVEFELLSIPFAAQVPCQIVYKDRRLTGFHRIDFVCFGEVVVEVKASSLVGPAEQAQILNYLALSGHRLGLLLNFGRPTLEYKRFVLD